MKILYLVTMNENNRKGLFTATHEKMKELVKATQVDEYHIFAVQFYDVGLLKLIKKLTKKSIRIKGSPIFEYEGIVYHKIYIKVGMINKVLDSLNMDMFNYLSFFMRNKDKIQNSDLISVHFGHPHGRIAYLINKLYKKPYIVTYHGSDVHTLPVNDYQIRKKVNKTMDNAIKNIFVSNQLYLAAKKIGYNKDNYIISKNGVNIDKFYPLQEDKITKLKDELNLNKKVVGFVGTLNKVKRSDKLVEIFENIRNMSKEEVSFLLVGDGPLRPSIQKEAKEKKLDIYFVGNTTADKVSECMSLMDVMVLPSRKEGFGCVILEANACGTVVIGSDAGGICEAIEDESLIVNEGENFEERFASKVHQLLLRNYDKDKLVQRVKNKFSWKAVAQDEINIYEGGFNE